MSETYTLESGEKFEEHSADECWEGVPCSFHSPSDHPLKDAPRRLNRKNWGVFRDCEHGLSHPDYDDFFGIPILHVCDGCCQPEESDDISNFDGLVCACYNENCPIATYFPEGEDTDFCPLCGEGEES